jgi:hypothetical protein
MLSKRPQSNSFLDSLQYPSIDRDQSSFNPEDVFLLPEDVNNFKKPRNVKNPITSTPPMAQSRTLTMTPPSMPTPRPSMPMNMPSMEEQQPEQDSTNFLGSLLAQGVASLGAGIQGRDIAQVGRSFEAGRQRAEQDRKAKALVDPKSEESKRRRMVFQKAMGFSIPEEYSATDLNDPVVLQSIRDKRMQELVPKGGTGIGVRGGVGQGKPEKEVKSDKKSLAEYKEHVSALTEMSGVIDNIKKLGRTRIGGITPDFSTDTQAISSSLDRAAQPMIKTLAGPGTLQKEERDTYSKLVPTGNTRSDLALRQADDIILDGTKISLGKMNTDLSVGNLNRQDYDSLINQYNEQLTKKGIGVNQVINPSTGQLEPRQRKEAELKDGRKVIIDQFGYTWE